MARWPPTGARSSSVSLGVEFKTSVEKSVSTASLRMKSPPHGATAPCGSRHPHYRGFTITLRHPRLLWTSDQPDVENSDNTALKETDIHARGGIWTHNSKERGDADSRLRPGGHRDCVTMNIRVIILIFLITTCWKNQIGDRKRWSVPWFWSTAFQLQRCDIWVSYSGADEEVILLGYDAV